MKRKTDFVTVSIIFRKDEVPKSFLLERPQLRSDGNAFCCFTGSNPQEGILGCGDTPHAAMKDWSRHHRKARARTFKKLKA